MRNNTFVPAASWNIDREPRARPRGEHEISTSSETKNREEINNEETLQDVSPSPPAGQVEKEEDYIGPKEHDKLMKEAKQAIYQDNLKGLEESMKAGMHPLEYTSFWAGSKG